MFCTILTYLFSNGQDARSTKLNFIVEQASCLFLKMVQDVRLNLVFCRGNQTSFIQTRINLPEQFKIIFG
jgi:hypothetical protein